METEYRGAEKSLTLPGRKQARKHFRNARDFNKIETRTLIKFLFVQDKEPKEIQTILTETLASFLPGRAKDVSAPLYWGEPRLYPGRVADSPNCTRNGYLLDACQTNYTYLLIC